MQHLNSDQLNELFAIPGHLKCYRGRNKFIFARIENVHASAVISIYGGQILSFEPDDEEPVLWRSRFSHYEEGKAIRGGIPIIWPWFGAHPTDSSKPSHGFARHMKWSVLGTEILQDGATQIRLGIKDSPETRALWPHSFELENVITVGKELEVELIVRNTGYEPFSYTGALHSYFWVNDITMIDIQGLENCLYIDKVDNLQRKVEQGKVEITGPTDRIYLDTINECVLYDQMWERRVYITKRGSRSTVIWNPWVDGTRVIEDFGYLEYIKSVCVETANAGDDIITVPAGGEQRLATVMRVEKNMKYWEGMLRY